MMPLVGRWFFVRFRIVVRPSSHLWRAVLSESAKDDRKQFITSKLMAEG